MAGSTSPSSLIHTACFLGAAISAALGVVVSFVTESVVATSAANVNAVKNAKKRNNLVNIFIPSMYKVLISYE